MYWRRKIERISFGIECEEKIRERKNKRRKINEKNVD